MLSQDFCLAGKAQVRQTSPGSAVGRDDLPLELSWGQDNLWLYRCLARVWGSG